METHRPTGEAELAELIAGAAAARRTLELRGGGSKRDIGAPTGAAIVEMRAFSGILDYDPAELVLTAGAATPLAQIEAALAEHGQMLAFEPFDCGPMFARPPGASTLGGVIASGVAGSRRLSRGGARDHLLGFRAVSGRGEVFVAGGKVVKNVTGYDLSKLMAGSWGRLAALTEVTLKVLPRPQMSLTLVAEGLAPPAAVALMARALGSTADVAAAAHAGGRTALRLEGFPPSVDARRTVLDSLGPLRPLAEEEAERFWASVRNPLPQTKTLLRVVIPAGKAAEAVDMLEHTGPKADWMMDWAGGLVWLAYDGVPDVARAIVEPLGGHAMIWRAPAATWARAPAFNERPPALAALEARVRRAFDPAGVFETGRFEAPVHAD